jgi:hypothetical protein
MQLPDKIISAQEVWIQTAMSICERLQIPVERNHFNIDKVFDDIKNFDKSIYEAFTDVRNAFEKYSLYYHALKRKEPGTIEELQRLEHFWKHTEDVLNKIVDSKAKNIKVMKTMSAVDLTTQKRANATIEKIRNVINHCGISTPWLYRKNWSIGYSHTNNVFNGEEFGCFFYIGADLPQAEKVIQNYKEDEGFTMVPYEGGKLKEITYVFIEYNRK